VALDDVGTGFSNMDRILLVKPNIIKIDASLVKNIHNDFYKQGVFKSLVIMANKIGALVIAEGVETEEEAIQVLRLGGHMIQGYYFSVPEKISDANTLYSNEKIAFLGSRFNQYMGLQYTKEKNKYRELNRLVNESVKRLAGRCRAEFDAELREIVTVCRTMECAYILDSAGVQISRTVCSCADMENRRNLIFYSAREGTDHSMEKYYYPLVSAKRKRYTTEPYISLATGNLCVTVSAVFESSEKTKCILCADFEASEDFYNIELRGPVIDMNFDSKPDISGILNRMSEEASTDRLTGAYSRRYIEERLLVDIYNAGMDKQPLTVVLADIDRFQHINSEYGHLAGDMVLKEFVAISRNFIRKGTDWIARCGSDKFLLVLINADKSVAERVSEKIRSVCEQTSIPYEYSQIRFTASLAAFTSHDRNMTPEELIRFADENLRKTRDAVRNQAGLGPSSDGAPSSGNNSDGDGKHREVNPQTKEGFLHVAVHRKKPAGAQQPPDRQPQSG
jgi:diguanylate cyclase (GGDEF)-like protein